MTSTPVSIVPCGYPARAWLGAERLAASDEALRVRGIGDGPTLWFPWTDVHVDGLRSAGSEAWGDGEVERFDAVAPLPPGEAAVTWSATPQPANGVGIVRRWVAPPPKFSALAGHATVDHTQVPVELVDAVPGDEPRDITVKRFPNWGDASDLIAVLGSEVAIADPGRPVVEGSQLLGQAIVAAMRLAPGRRVVSAHMVFLRAADAARLLDVSVSPLTAGRTFTGFDARITQADRLVAAGTLLLGVVDADVVAHGPVPPDIGSPYDAVPYDMGVTGRDLRVVDGAYTDDPAAPVGPPSIDAWVRFRSVPADPAIHAGLLAQFTGHMSIAAALRPHAGIGQREAHRTISTAINAIGISFHADVRMDRWVLYRHLATTVAGGMAHAECRAHDEAGTLVASFTVEAMIRPLDRPGSDARTAL